MNKVFIDTCILIYLTYDKSEFNEKAKKKIKELSSDNDFYISNQIILEYINTVSNKKIFNEELLPVKKAVENIQLFLSVFKAVDKSPDAKELKDSLLTYDVSGSALFNLNIYLTMKANGIKAILTINTKDFDLFKNINVLSL